MELSTGKLHDSMEDGLAAGNDRENLMEVQDKMLTAQAKKTRKVGRNDPCPCGSEKKFKTCCWTNNPLDRLKKNKTAVIEELRHQNKELTIQLAYCMTAATGEGDEIRQGDFGWSPSYGVVCELREDFDSLLIIERDREQAEKDRQDTMVPKAEQGTEVPKEV